MGGRQAVRPRTLDPVSKVRILPAQPLHRFGWLKSPLFGISQGAPFRGERRSCFTATWWSDRCVTAAKLDRTNTDRIHGTAQRGFENICR